MHNAALSRMRGTYKRIDNMYTMYIYSYFRFAAASLTFDSFRNHSAIYVKMLTDGGWLTQEVPSL